MSLLLSLARPRNAAHAVDELKVRLPVSPKTASLMNFSLRNELGQDDKRKQREMKEKENRDKIMRRFATVPSRTAELQLDDPIADHVSPSAKSAGSSRSPRWGE